jgi:hypothetical protein
MGMFGSRALLTSEVLHLGTLEADEAYVLRHANAHKHYSENGPRRTRRLPINAALIKHPEEGLILFDTGAAEDIEKVTLMPTPG